MSENSEHDSLSSSDQKGAGNLSSEVQTLTGMIKDLEQQLDRMIAINDALTGDLEAERKRRVDLETTVDELKERLRHEQDEVATKDSLRAEISHLGNERSRLTASVRELSQKLADTEQESRKQTASIKRLQASRADALEEVQAVEAQFERAMQMVTDARAQLMVLQEERDALKGHIKGMEDRLGRANDERDYLHEEVEESRNALAEIRRSLADVVVVSTGALSDEPGAEKSDEQPADGTPG
jgi:chromosome segregation ATPase